MSNERDAREAEAEAKTLADDVLTKLAEALLAARSATGSAAGYLGDAAGTAANGVAYALTQAASGAQSAARLVTEGVAHGAANVATAFDGVATSTAALAAGLVGWRTERRAEVNDAAFNAEVKAILFRAPMELRDALKMLALARGKQLDEVLIEASLDTLAKYGQPFPQALVEKATDAPRRLGQG